MSPYSITNTDTIIAIASPLGNSHQAIIRLSGPASLPLIKDSFIPHPNHWDSFSTVKGHILANGLKIPTQLYVMKSPRSYTREDIVEIHTLGVLPLLNLIIEDFTRRGARLARAGEFTQRAFLNGRIDLAQAEAVLEIIQSRNEQELTLATRQLTGQFSKHLRKIKQALVDLLAHLELSLDFSDQVTGGDPEVNHQTRLRRDIEILSLSEVKSRLNGLLHQVAMFLSGETRPVYKEGIKVVICGRPNVGKSSLFNRLLGKDHAIVTIIPGTTTDVLEGHLKMADTTFRLFDTAGLGKVDRSGDYSPIHQMAQERARLILKNADIFLLIVDGNEPFGEEDRTVFDNLNDSRAIIIINKTDLPAQINPNKVRRFLGRDLSVLQTSARTGKGISGLKKYLVQSVSEMRIDKSSSEYSINTRHRISLTKTYEGLKAALKIAETEIGEPTQSANSHIKSGDLIALELREALNGVGEVLGDPERFRGGEVLNHIFSQFCIGK